MSTHYMYHHQYVVSKISNRHKKDKYPRQTPNQSPKSKPPKCSKRGSIQAILKQLTKAKQTSHARRLLIRKNKVGGQPNDCWGLVHNSQLNIIK
jgi:hypothetical protein